MKKLKNLLAKNLHKNSKFNFSKNETKLEVNVKLKEDIFDKRVYIADQESEYKHSYQINLNSESIENSTLDQLINILKNLVKTKNTNFDTWYKAINKFNDLLCNLQVGKNDLIEVLEILNFFQPKILEKNTIPKEFSTIESKISFSKNHEEEYNRITGPSDILTQFAIFLKKNVKPILVKEFIKDNTKFENREDIDESLEDLLGIYEILFRNIEMKILDDVRNGRASYSFADCIKLISSFSRASEGTNLLYEVLMRKISKHADELSLAEIEVIINYLPHDLYNNNNKSVEEDITFMEKNTNDTKNNTDEQIYPENGRTFEINRFYKIIFDKISSELNNLDDQKFINFFQGLLKMKFIDTEVLSSFFNNFDLRINKCEKDKKFFFDFLQIFTYFLKIEENQKFLSIFDMNIIYKSIEQLFIKKYLNSFDLKEISTIFWIFYHMQIISDDKINLFEKPIKSILINYLNDPKDKIDSMGYESNQRYYDKYSIEPYDLEALQFFLQSKINKGDLINIIKKCLKSIQLENTHPISRKWFHF